MYHLPLISALSNIKPNLILRSFLLLIYLSALLNANYPKVSFASDLPSIYSALDNQKKNHRSSDWIDSPTYSGLVINTNNGEILYNKNANSIRHPASLTKMMTLYLTFEALKKGKLHIKQKITISNTASSQPRSNLGLQSGEKITILEAIHALAIKSANDVAYALAESIGGDMKHFIVMMNNKAKQLGMKNTTFQNPSGLHHPEQVTTAYDIARLAMALRYHYANYYHIFSRTHFVFKGKNVNGHNKILKRYKGADGLKTGFINASGFNLVTSVRKPEGNLIAVVMGGPTANSRDDHMIKLLNQAYEKIKNKNSTLRRNSSSKIQNSKEAAYHPKAPNSSFTSLISTAEASSQLMADNKSNEIKNKDNVFSIIDIKKENIVKRKSVSVNNNKHNSAKVTKIKKDLKLKKSNLKNNLAKKNKIK